MSVLTIDTTYHRLFFFGSTQPSRVSSCCKVVFVYVSLDYVQVSNQGDHCGRLSFLLGQGM